jgi:oligopeptide transport system substrate-binding protein
MAYTRSVLRTLAYFSVFAAFAAVSGCTSRQADGRKNFTRKTLSFSLPDDMKNMDPATAYDTVAMDVIPLVLESLYQYNYDRRPLVLEPLLAAGLPEISKDRKTYTIRLKKGVRWHAGDYFPKGEGRELVAADFLFAWKRLAIAELQSPGSWIFDGKVKGWDEFRAGRAGDVTGFSAPDAHTLKIELLRPYPQLSHVLAMAYSSPLPKELFEKYGLHAMNERLPGTGPYKFHEYVRASRLTLLKNDAYRGESYRGGALPFAEELNFRIFKEDQPRWLEFTRGNLDVSGIPKDNFSSVVDQGELRGEMAAKGIQFLKLEQASLYFLLFNMRDPVLGKNRALRQAISMAFDRKAFVEKFRNGRGVNAVSLVPRTVEGHVERENFPFEYDLNAAKAKLAEAGYPGGKGLPAIRLDMRGNSTNNRLQAEFIKDALAKLGIQVEVALNALPGYLEKERNGNLQLVLGLWDSDYPDAENFLALLYSKNVAPGPNVSHYQNPAFDRLFEKIALMENGPARFRLIREAEDIAYADLPIAPLFYPLAFSVGHGWVKNFRPNIQVTNHMKYFDVDLELQKKLEPALR